MTDRRIVRARMFLGALLLFAALVSWGTGLTMSPHGETVARGTEYLRSTVVTFKRNSAIGTLILAAVSAWLLFPTGRPKWPARDRVLIGLFVILSASSIYTLIWLGPSRRASIRVDENLATLNVNSNADTSATDIEAASMNGMLAPQPVQIDSHASRIAPPRPNSDPARSGRQGQSAGMSATDGPADAETGSPDDTTEPANNPSDENRD